MEILFAFLVSLLIFAEHKLYKTYFTPFSITAIVNLLLILLNNLIATRLGFFGVTSRSIFYILCFLILIFFVSMCFYFLMKPKLGDKSNKMNDYIYHVIYRNRKVIVILFLIGLVAKYISLFQAISYFGLTNIKGNAFGVFAHLGDIAVVLTPYIMFLFYKNKKSIHYLIMILLIFLNLLLFGGKYGILITLVHLVIFYAFITNISTKKTFKIGLITSIFGIFMFIMVYAVKPIIIQGSFNISSFINNLYFSLRHFLFYLVSPIISTNYYFNHVGESPHGIQTLFAVPINLFIAIFKLGNYVDPVNHVFIYVSPIYSTNVGGLIAESVYSTGFVMACVYISVFFCIAYFFYIKSRYQGKMVNLTALILAIVTMMFFSNFLTVSGIISQMFTLWLIEILLNKKIVLRG